AVIACTMTAVTVNGCKKGRTLTTENGDDVCRDTVLSRCQNCPMSKGEYRISRAKQGRKISMPPTAPPTAPFGAILQGKASRSFSAAAQRVNVSKQGN